MGEYLDKTDFYNIYKEIYGDKNDRSTKNYILNKIEQLRHDKKEYIEYQIKDRSKQRSQIVLSYIILLFMLVSIITMLGYQVY